MSSRRGQTRASIMVTKKVLFLGRWHTNEVTEDIMQHLRRNLPLVPSQKAKLKLSELGIYFGKRVVIGRTQEEFIPMERIVQVVPDAVHTTVLLCLIKAGVKSVYDILVFRCASEKDARESAEVFRRLRALSQGTKSVDLTAGYGVQNRNEFCIKTNGHLGSNGNRQRPGVGISPQMSPGAEEQEEAILVVTPEPRAVSPGREEAYLASTIHHQYGQSQSHPNNLYQSQSNLRRMDESDSAFKRRMRQQMRDALRRNRNRSEAESNLLAQLGPDESDSNGEYLVDSEFDQVDQNSYTDSMAIQQRALNDKVANIAEEVHRLKSVFETTLRSGASTTALNAPAGQHQRYSYGESTHRLGRSPSTESDRHSRSPSGRYLYAYRQRSTSPYNRCESPPLGQGETFRRRHVVTEMQQMSPPTGRSSRKYAYVYKQSNNDPEIIYRDAPSRGVSTLNVRRSTTHAGSSMVRANVQNGMRSGLSINTAGCGGNFVGTSSSKISKQRRAHQGGIQRSKSSQWIGGNLAQVVSTTDLDRCGGGSPEIDDRIRRQRDLADRIRQERREVVRSKMGIVDREKWELTQEPMYLIRSDNKQQQDRPGGVRLYKARSVPNFLASRDMQSQSSKYQQQAAVSKRQPQTSVQVGASSNNLNRGSTSNGVPTKMTNAQQPTYLVAVQPPSSVSSTRNGPVLRTAAASSGAN